MQEPSRKSLVGDRDIRAFLAGRLVSEIGARLTREGLPLVAILAAAATASQVGLLAALTMVPALVFGTPAGLLTDRRRRRPLMIAADIVSAGLLLSIPVAAALHRLGFPQVAIVGTLVAAVNVFFQVADRAFVPFLFSRERLDEGNAVIGSVESVGETAGPLLLGVLVQAIGAPFTILIDALSHLASALSLGLIKRQEPPPRPGVAFHRRHVGQGFRVLQRHPVLRSLALTQAFDGLFGGFHAALYELYVLRTLHLTPFLLGLLITCGGAGALIGSLAAPSLARRRGLPIILAASFLAFATINVLIPLAQPATWTAFGFLLAAQVGGDLFGTIYSIQARVLEQRVTPDAWLGRVNGTIRTLTGGLGVLGALAAGAIASQTSPRDAIAVAAVGEILAGLFLLSPAIRTYADSPAAAVFETMD